MVNYGERVKLVQARSDAAVFYIRQAANMKNQFRTSSSRR